MIAWITGWKALWPKVTAPSITSSDSSWASDSTISTPSVVPATHQFELRCLQAASAVGFRMYSPSHVADAGGGDRAEERDAGQRQRRRAADHGDDVGIVLQVVAQHGGDDLDLVAEPIREQRADRPVDQAGGQHLVLGRPALALEEPAGDLARRRRPFPGSSRSAGRNPAPAWRCARRPRCTARWCRHSATSTAPSAWRAILPVSRIELAPAPVEFLAEIIEHAVVLAMRRASADGNPDDPSSPVSFAGYGVSGRMGAAAAPWAHAPQPCGRKRRRLRSRVFGQPDRRSVVPPRSRRVGGLAPALPRATMARGSAPAVPAYIGAAAGESGPEAGRAQLGQRRRLSRPISVS